MPASTGVRRAKFDTDCAVCPRRLRRGQPMLPSYANMRDGLGVSRWAHVECIAQAERRRQAKADAADAADAAQRRRDQRLAAVRHAQQAVEAQLGWPIERPTPEAPKEVPLSIQDSVTLITHFERTGCLRCPDNLSGPQLSQWLKRQAGLITAAMRRDSRLTFPRLEAAVRYFVQERVVVDRPGALLPQLALRLPKDTTAAPSQEPDPVGQVLIMLVSLEMNSDRRDDDDDQDWLGRLVRCSGSGRRDVIEQYIASDQVNADVQVAVAGVLALAA